MAPIDMVAPLPCPAHPPSLAIWDDPEPRDGPMSMALDEALLSSVLLPVLRVYRWRERTLSIGCFVALSEARAGFGSEWAVVRRWTGGGVVPHGTDWTYSLIVPATSPLGRGSAATTYRMIHGALAAALRTSRIDAELASEAPAGRGGLCFAAAVTADVLVDGRKVAGGAQRRTRHGVLHQGSVQGTAVPAGMAAAFAAHLGIVDPLPFRPNPSLLALADTLAREKYGAPAWLHRVP